MIEFTITMIWSYIASCMFVAGYQTKEHTNGENNIVVITICGIVIAIYYIIAFPFIIIYAIFKLIGVIKLFNFIESYLPIRFLFSLYVLKKFDNWEYEKLEIINQSKIANEKSLKGEIYKRCLKLLNKRNNYNPKP